MTLYMNTNTFEEDRRTDEEILARAIHSPSLFEILIGRYKEPFQRKACHILRNENDAEDGVQETFVKIYIAAKKFKNIEGGSFKSWAYKILINECFYLYKKRNKAAYIPFDGEIEEAFSDKASAAAYEKKLDTDYVLSLISKLPVVMRRILTLHFIDDKPQKEIAVLEGIPETAVRVRIFRAKNELKKLITKRQA